MEGREPFLQREKRESKKETESATLSSHKMNISLEHGLGAGFLSVTGFLETVCGAQTRVVEVHDFCKSRAVECDPREKEGTGPRKHNIV